jgi:hypothetical protein
MEPVTPQRQASRPSPSKMAPDDPVTPRLTPRKFWLLFMATVHDTLSANGPLTVRNIMAKLPDGWMGATARYGKAAPGKTIWAGRLRQKLRQRIVEGRPFKELDEDRFAVNGPWLPKCMPDDEDAA